MPDEEAVSLQSDADGPNCRICYCSSDEPLCSPCKCTGTVLHVHQSCLDRWVELRPSDWNGKCDVCQYKLHYEDHEVSQGAVTWAIYFNALGKYLLSVGSFILPILAIFASFLINMKRMADEESMIFLTISSTVVNLQMAVFIMKYLKLPILQRHLKWAKSPLPKIGQVKSSRKIRETTYKDVIKSDFLYALVVLTFVVVTTGLVQVVAPYLPRSEVANSTAPKSGETETTESIPSRWTRRQLEMEALALFLIGIFALLEFTSLVILPFHEFLNRVIRHTFSFVFGKLLNHIITRFFVGWYTDCYNSALVTGTFFLDLSVGQLIVLELAELYIMGYGKVLNIAANASILRFPIQNVENKYRDGLRRIQYAVLYIVLTMVVFMILPLYLTSWALPSMLPLNLGTYDSRNISERIFGEGHNRSDTLIKVFEGMNRAVMTMFVFNVISYAFPVANFVFNVFGVLHRAFSAKKSKLRGCILSIFVLLFTAVLFTAVTLFALLFGRFVSRLLSFPDVYSNDVVALGIGWLFLRIFGTSVQKFVRAGGVIAACLCNAAMYLLIIKLLVESYNPVQVETVFFVSWIFIDPKHNKTDKEVFLLAWSSVQRLAVTASLLLPLYVGIWTGILPSSLETVKSFSSFKWFFLGYSLGVLVICLSIYSVYLLWKLHYHLRFEYEEIMSVLLNYDPEMENAEPKNKYWVAMKPYKDYSICGYAQRLVSGAFRRRPRTANEETVMQNVL
ncbi:hypothetical protein QR680_011223 [Steinernema hermaphroditum]|uniref:RING-CH-type domain-containing protein n=1 Tax=Steinernema hermaphroditum TaxID=289476 RepID=A0AA39MCU7_9BILA|nr:hypothetical protein QR680_011223 [Steinernema hermaphroditum]